jgi:ABC-type branched-subunit amino acid transport system substrate-binding protein
VTEDGVRVRLRSVWTAAALAAALCAGAARAQASGVSDGEVLFGMAGPLSGPARELGLQLKTGVEVAFAAQNAAGGVHGRKLRLVAADDGGEPSRALPVVKDLVEARRVFALVGNVGSASAEVAVPYANEKGVLLYGAFSGSSLLRNDPPDRFVFNYRASDAQETAAMVGHLLQVRGVKPGRIAVFAEETAFGDAGFAGVARVLRQHRRDPASILRVGYRRNTADVDEAVKKVRKHGGELDAVVMVASYKPAARFIEKLRDAGMDLVFTNVSSVGSNELAEELAQLGPRYADGVLVTQVVPLPTSRASAILRYQAELQKHAPGERPGFVSLEGWVAARILVAALERAGKALTTDRLIAALEELKALDLGIGVPVTFGPSQHQASSKVWGTVMDAKGQFTPVELE